MDKLRDYTIGGKMGVIEDLWKLFAGAYGSLWRNKYGEAVRPNERTNTKELTEAGLEWARKLGEFTEKTIDQAIENCQSAHADRPPNLYQFMKICKKLSPKEKNPYQDSHLCEHTDERGFRCASHGTLSTNLREGGPWLCARHYGGDSEIQKRRNERVDIVEKYHVKFMQEHPRLRPQPGDKPGDVARRNLKFIKHFLKGGAIGQELPYDKNERITGDDAGMTREQSLGKAEKD